MFVDVDNCKNENRKLVVHETELSVLVGPIFPTVKNQSNYQIKSGLPGMNVHAWMIHLRYILLSACDLIT